MGPAGAGGDGGGGTACGVPQNTALYDEADVSATTRARGNTTIVYATPVDVYGDSVPATYSVPGGTYGDATHASAEQSQSLV